MEALKILRVRSLGCREYIIIFISILLLFSISFFRFYTLVTSTYRIEIERPNLSFLEYQPPEIAVTANLRMPEVTSSKKFAKSKKLIIKSPSVYRDNTEYLAYSEFKEIESMELKISKELELANTLVSKKENLISWSEFIGRPIFGNRLTLLSFIEELKNDKTVETKEEDRISIVQSATQERAELEEIVEYNLASDEKDVSVTNPFISSPGVSNRVDNVIDRLMSAVPIRNQNIKVPKKQTAKKSNWIEISLSPLDKGQSAQTNLEDFEFTPFYNPDESVRADGKFVRIENLCTNGCGNLEGKISALGMADVYVKIPLIENTNISSDVVTMTDTEFQNIYEENKLSPETGVILIKLEDRILNIDLDREYKLKTMLNKNGATTDSITDAEFILVIGVDAGPVTISYQLENGWAQDLLGVRSQSLTFIKPDILSKQQNVTTFMLQDTLSSKSRPLELNTNDIKSFDKYEEIAQITYNQFTFKNEYFVKGYRNYRQVFYGRNSIFSAHQFNDEKTQSEILLPSQEFKRVVSDYLSASEDSGQCVIQINNSTNRLESISIQQFNFRNEFESGTVISLDEEGTFSSDISASTKNIFINSDVPGTIHLQLNYLDGKVRFLNTFCIKGTYLVEHL